MIELSGKIKQELTESQTGSELIGLQRLARRQQVRGERRAWPRVPEEPVQLGDGEQNTASGDGALIERM